MKKRKKKSQEKPAKKKNFICGGEDTTPERLKERVKEIQEKRKLKNIE